MSISRLKRVLPVGSTYIAKDGVKWIKINKYIWDVNYRIKIEKYIGRKLKRTEIVHHIDGNRTNEKLTNLYVFKRRLYHQFFETLVRVNILDRFILKSNLKEIKNG